jgi:hypothetical protein
MGKLLIKKDGGVVQEFILKPGVTTCGRKPENNLVLNDGSVSGYHCELDLVSGELYVRDLGSTNGTYINDEQIQDGILQSGQTLRIGSVEAAYDATATSSTLRVALTQQCERPPGMAPPPEISSEGGGLRIAKPETPAPPPPPPSANVRRPLPRSSAPKVYRTFFQSLPEAFRYPLKQDGLILLISGTVVFTLVDYFQKFAGSFIIAILSFGYMAAYMQKIVACSAQGDANLPDWPEFSNYWEDIVHPALLLGGSFAVSLGPAIGFWFWTDLDPSTRLMGAIALFAFGCIYLPMALLAVSMYTSLFALNPLLIVPSMIRIPREYFVACLLLGALAGFKMLSSFLPGRIHIPILPTVIVSFLSLYCVTLEMRVLGLLYFCKKRELNWSF